MDMTFKVPSHVSSRKKEREGRTDCSHQLMGYSEMTVFHFADISRRAMKQAGKRLLVKPSLLRKTRFFQLYSLSSSSPRHDFMIYLSFFEAKIWSRCMDSGCVSLGLNCSGSTTLQYRIGFGFIPDIQDKLSHLFALVKLILWID